MFFRSAISPGPVGCHPRRFCVSALETIRFLPANIARNPKWAGASSGDRLHHRHLQALANHFSNLPQRHALFRDRVISSARFIFLQSKSVEASRIGDMRRRPAIEPITYVGRDSLLDERARSGR